MNGCERNADGLKHHLDRTLIIHNTDLTECRPPKTPIIHDLCCQNNDYSNSDEKKHQFSAKVLAEAPYDENLRTNFYHIMDGLSDTQL